MGKAEQTRQYIIEKTAPIFNKKGYAGTSLTDLTEATKLTKGAIYGNFQNKDEVAAAAFDYNLKQLKYRLYAKVSAQENAVDKLLACLDFYRDFHQTQCLQGGCPIMNTAIEADDTHPVLQARVAQELKKWIKNLADLVAEGIQKKEITPGANPDEFAGLMVSMIEGGVLLCKTLNEPRYLIRNLDHLENIIRNNLAAKREAARKR